MAIIDSMLCAGQAQGKSIFAVSSTECELSRHEQILDASVSSPMKFF